MDFLKNQEDTKELNELSDLKNKTNDPLENDLFEDLEEEFLESEMKEENADKPFLQEEKTETIFEEPMKKKKKTWRDKIKSLKEKWKNLPKKKKGMILLLIFLILVCLSIGIFFLVKSFNKEIELPNIPDVIVDEENYRYLNGKLSFIDEDKKELGTYECRNKDQNLCYVAFLSGEDNFDEQKRVYDSGTKILTRSSIYLNQYAFIYDNDSVDDGMITLLDFKNNKEIGTYSLVKSYFNNNNNNNVILKNKMNQYGYFLLTESELKPVIDFSDDYMGIMENNLLGATRLVTKRNSKWYLTDLENKTLTKAINYEIKDFNDKYIKVIDESGSYHLIDYNNSEINASKYQYIDLLKEYVLFVENNKIMVRDYNNKKMNLDGIEIFNTNFVKKSTYDMDKKLIKDEISYETELNDNILNVKVKKESETLNFTVNLNEGRVSATLKNMDYFNGKLYFYSDTEKNKTLGTYTCNNKNTMNDSTTSLDHCKVAKESFYQDNDRENNSANKLGVLPIFNERFVFIDDSPNEADKNIVLYHLKDNKELAKYKSVDAGIYTGTNDVNFLTVNDIYIIAENKSGKFGMVKLQLTNVAPAIEFQYDHLERMDLLFIAHNSSGYFLINKDNLALTKTTTSKIRDYNSQYITVLNNKKYYLYDYAGKSVNPAGFDYIKLYDNYYAGVNNELLNLFDYKKPTDALFKDSVQLYLNHYFGEGTLAFKMVINKENAKVSIGKSNNTYDDVVVSFKVLEDGSEENNGTN